MPLDRRVLWKASLAFQAKPEDVGRLWTQRAAPCAVACGKAEGARGNRFWVSTGGPGFPEESIKLSMAEQDSTTLGYP